DGVMAREDLGQQRAIDLGIVDDEHGSYGIHRVVPAHTAASGSSLPSSSHATPAASCACDPDPVCASSSDGNSVLEGGCISGFGCASNCAIGPSCSVGGDAPSGCAIDFNTPPFAAGSASSGSSLNSARAALVPRKSSSGESS